MLRRVAITLVQQLTLALLQPVQLTLALLQQLTLTLLQPLQLALALLQQLANPQQLQLTLALVQPITIWRQLQPHTQAHAAQPLRHNRLPRQRSCGQRHKRWDPSL